MIQTFLHVVKLLIFVHIFQSPPAFGLICNQTQECAYSEASDLSGSVQCDGYLSCQGTTIIALDDIDCFGHSACMNAIKIDSKQGDIRCYGYLSCSGVSVIMVQASSSSIFCHGSWGCAWSDLITNNTNSWGSNTLNCGGYYSCRTTKISKFTTIIATGYHSIDSADITSDGLTSSTMNVFIYGYEAGIDATITCTDGYTCNIYCSGLGCYGTVLDGSGEFEITCDTIDIQYCPTFKTNSSTSVVNPTNFPTNIATTVMPTVNPTNEPITVSSNVSNTSYTTDYVSTNISSSIHNQTNEPINLVVNTSDLSNLSYVMNSSELNEIINVTDDYVIFNETDFNQTPLLIPGSYTCNCKDSKKPDDSRAGSILALIIILFTFVLIFSICSAYLLFVKIPFYKKLLSECETVAMTPIGKTAKIHSNQINTDIILDTTLQQKNATNNDILKQETDRNSIALDSLKSGGSGPGIDLESSDILQKSSETSSIEELYKSQPSLHNYTSEGRVNSTGQTG